MFPLRCSVRNCQKRLLPSDLGLTCSTGHHFDRAKQGYWSLLQPQDRKSANPGDSDDAVLARHRWLQRGHMAGFVQTLKPWTEIHSQQSTPTILDLGCGEGTFGPALFQGCADGFCGIDLSRRAIKLAARSWPAATWVVANADRELPVADGCVDCIVSLFGRRPISEIQRVLAAGGKCIVAVPGEEDLIELRELVQQSGQRRNRWQLIVDEMESAGLKLLERVNWQHQVDLDADAMSDALAMTYRAVRRSQQVRLDGVQQMRVTLSADILVLQTADSSEPASKLS